MQDKINPDDPKFLQKNFRDGKGYVSVSDGVYKIYTALNNSSLVDMSLTADVYEVHNVMLRRDNNSPESMWRIFRHTSPFPRYEIRSEKNHSLLLGLGDRGSDGYNAIAEQAPSDSDAHAWYFLDAGNGLVYIANYMNEMMINVEESNTADGTNILVTAPYHGDQMFRLAKIREL